MRRMWLVLMAAGLMVGGVAMAQDWGMGEADEGGDAGGGKKAKKEKKEKKEKKAKAPKAPLQELTLEGKITKTEKKGKASYVLTTADGAKVSLKTPKAKKGAEAPAINLEDYVDADVTLVGQGSQSEKKGKKQISLKTITSITKKDAMM